MHWLMEHQKEAGVFAKVSDLANILRIIRRARLTAQDIAERVKLAEQGQTLAVK